MSFRPLSSRRASNAENAETLNRTKRLSEASKPSLGEAHKAVAVPPPSRNVLLSRSLNIPHMNTAANSTAIYRPSIAAKPQPLQALTRRPLQPCNQPPAAQKIEQPQTLIQPASGSVTASGVSDSDKADMGDPKFVAEYVGEIFQRLLARPDGHPVGDYLGAFLTGKKPTITPAMRSVLVDWLVEVHWKFKLYPESLFLCVSLLDRFLARTPELSKSQLQLVGTTCLLIAAKFEDIFAPEIKDLVLICERTYRKEEILAMEVKILNTLEFELTTPSALLYLLRLGKLQGCDERHFYLAQYCLELGLPVYALWTKRSALELAAGALYLSNKLLRKAKAWSDELKGMCGLGEGELKVIAKELCNLLQVASDADTGANAAIGKAVKNKFSQNKYHCVAKMVL